MKRIVEITEDGSTTLFVPDMDEHYHSTKGALTESQHIFIEMGFHYPRQEKLNILEIGLGTGLNAWLTLLEAGKTNRQVNYTALELYPLQWEEIKELHYTDDPLFQKIHEKLWGKNVGITPNFNLHKIKCDFTTYRFDIGTKFDVVYFDAFAPEKQPEMWQPILFDYLHSILAENGVLTTYCAKGMIRRMLQNSGFKVERLPGPPGGKREILRAIKYGDLNTES